MNNTRWMAVMHDGRKGYVMMEYHGMTPPRITTLSGEAGVWSEPIWKPMPVIRMKDGIFEEVPEKTVFFDFERFPLLAEPAREIYIKDVRYCDE